MPGCRLTHHQKQHYHRVACRVGLSRTKKSAVAPGQPTFHQVLSTPSVQCVSEHQCEEEVRSNNSDADEPVAGVDGGERIVSGVDGGEHEGTHHFPRYNIDHPMFYRFENYLTGIDGGQRSPKTAREIAQMSVSTFDTPVARTAPIRTGPTSQIQIN